MDYVTLGKSDCKVSRLGFGCCPMGGHGWGAVSCDELCNAVQVALDYGVTFFDTADIYGLGESERRLGAYLNGRKKDVVIATKFGVRRNDQGVTYYDNSPAWIAKALDGSLKRLGVDCIDLYQIHYWDGTTKFADIVETLERKCEQGKIRYYGLSNISQKDLAGVDLSERCLSFQAEYSLVNRSRERDLVRMRSEKEIEFMSWGSLGQGFLGGKYDEKTYFPADDRRSWLTYPNFHGDLFKQNLVMIDKMRAKFAGTGRALAQIAIRWIIDRLGFGVVLAGIKNPRQIVENTGAFGWNLLEDDLVFLDDISTRSTTSFL